MIGSRITIDGCTARFLSISLCAACTATEVATILITARLCYQAGMTLVVDIRHWLDENGDPHPRVRKQALRMARLIEYGGRLARGQCRETLVECSRRPVRKPCLGLLWVLKADDDTIDAYCHVCKAERILISGWQETQWADGPMEPFSTDDLPPLH